MKGREIKFKEQGNEEIKLDMNNLENLFENVSKNINKIKASNQNYPNKENNKNSNDMRDISESIYKQIQIKSTIRHLYNKFSNEHKEDKNNHILSTQSKQFLNPSVQNNDFLKKNYKAPSKKRNNINKKLMAKKMEIDSNTENINNFTNTNSNNKDDKNFKELHKRLVCYSRNLQDFNNNGLDSENNNNDIYTEQTIDKINNMKKYLYKNTFSFSNTNLNIKNSTISNNALLSNSNSQTRCSDNLSNKIPSLKHKSVTRNNINKASRNYEEEDLNNFQNEMNLNSKGNIKYNTIFKNTKIKNNVNNRDNFLNDKKDKSNKDEYSYTKKWQIKLDLMKIGSPPKSKNYQHGEDSNLNNFVNDKNTANNSKNKSVFNPNALTMKSISNSKIKNSYN